MAKEELINLWRGKTVFTPNALSLELENKHIINCSISGKIRRPILTYLKVIALTLKCLIMIQKVE